MTANKDSVFWTGSGTSGKCQLLPTLVNHKDQRRGMRKVQPPSYVLTVGLLPVPSALSKSYGSDRHFNKTRVRTYRASVKTGVAAAYLWKRCQ